MVRSWSKTLAVLTLIASSLWVATWPPRTQAATPGITLVGQGLVNGTELDTSGLQGTICHAGVPTNCVPKAIFGGFGSDLTYTGHDNVFLAAPDVGAAGAFDITSDLGTLRLDPEGIRVGKHGTFYISDEYGPYVFEFNREGHLVRRIAIPTKFSIANPSANPDTEL